MSAGSEGNADDCFSDCLRALTACASLPEYSKRVYQGVRVKHTVKDLLAEKRSRQTSASRYSVSSVAAATPLSACLRLVCVSPKPNTAARRSVGGIVGVVGPPAPVRPHKGAQCSPRRCGGGGGRGRGGKAKAVGGGRMDGLCKVASKHLPASFVSAADKPAIVASAAHAITLAAAAFRRRRAAAGAAFHRHKAFQPFCLPAAAASACPR